MQGYEITTIGVPIMVGSHIRKVGPGGLEKFMRTKSSLRLRFNDGVAGAG
jgi:hypothetical protein